MHHWHSAPAAVRTQVDSAVAALKEICDLTGIYLHGSLAMGCFNPGSSDIDLLGVTPRALTDADRITLAGRLLELSGAPSPLELSLVSEADLQPWRFPVPFQFHYSEGWRERFSQALGSGLLPAQPADDPDLAAHMMILHHRGVVLHGAPIEETLPLVPPADYLAAIWEHDTRQPGDWVTSRPVYWVLNLCRVLAYASEGCITSKAEGGVWAVDRVPAEHRPLVGHALALYRGESDQPAFDQAALNRFAAFMGAAIDSLIRGM